MCCCRLLAEISQKWQFSAKIKKEEEERGGVLIVPTGSSTPRMKYGCDFEGEEVN